MVGGREDPKAVHLLLDIPQGEHIVESVGNHHGQQAAGLPVYDAEHRAAGAGNANDIWVPCYKVTAKIVKISSTKDIVLLYWKKGEWSLDRSLTRTRLFSITNKATAMPQPMK